MDVKKEGYKTLREECFFKTGRKGVVFEAIDKLSPNLFNDNNNIGSHIFKKDSKITLTLVDARYGEGRGILYNLDPAEVILLTILLSDGIATSFKNRVGAYNAISGKEQVALRNIIETFDSVDFSRFDRMMDYNNTKPGTAVHFQKNIHIGDNKLIVRKFSISYEEAMKSDSKWKITIEEGTAMKDTSNSNGLNIVKYGTYKEKDKSYLMLEANEIIVPLSEAASRVIAVKGLFYNQMKIEQISFTNRKNKERDYKGERIKEWNPQGVPWYETPEYLEEQAKKKAEQPSNVSNKTVENNEDSKLICADCGIDTPENVYNYSKRVLGRPLCFNCQKKVK